MAVRSAFKRKMDEFRNASRQLFDTIIQTVLTNNSGPPLWERPPNIVITPPSPPQPNPPYQPPMMPAPSYAPDFRNGDSGYFFAPYVPMTQTPVVLDPNSFHRNGIMTHYGRRRLEEGRRNYGRLVIDQNGARHEKYEAPERAVDWKKEGF